MLLYVCLGFGGAFFVWGWVALLTQIKCSLQTAIRFKGMYTCKVNPRVHDMKGHLLMMNQLGYFN